MAIRPTGETQSTQHTRQAAEREALRLALAAALHAAFSGAVEHLHLKMRLYGTGEGGYVIPKVVWNDVHAQAHKTWEELPQLEREKFIGTADDLLLVITQQFDEAEARDGN